jgi:hypothetical protein
LRSHDRLIGGAQHREHSSEAMHSSLGLLSFCNTMSDAHDDPAPVDIESPAVHLGFHPPAIFGRRHSFIAHAGIASGDDRIVIALNFSTIQVQ